MDPRYIGTHFRIARTIAPTGVYVWRELVRRKPRRRIEPPLVAVDLGANIGLFGLRLLAQRPDAKIVAVEPDPANVAVLRQTIAASGCRQWSVVEGCAAPADGVVCFRQGDYLESRVGAGGDPFPAIDIFPTLADADLIKIDIEGSELALLEDQRFASLAASVLYLEYHPPHEREHVTDLILAAGYTIEPFEERLPGIGELWAWKPPANRAADAGQRSHHA